MNTHGLRWADIARSMPGRTDQQCMGRWRRHLDPGISREQWSTKEDRRLTELRVEHGANWSAISKTMKNRPAQQCRARWFQAHFTGHRYLDDEGNLLTPRRADKAEKEVDFAKAAAAKAGKTLRPNGVKAAAANHNVDNIINNRGIVKEEKSDRGKKRRRTSSGSSGSDDEGKPRRLPSLTPLARDASGRFAPREDDAWTPAPAPITALNAPPILKTKVPDALDAGGVGMRRSLSLNRQVSLPPDIADLIAREAAAEAKKTEAGGDKSKPTDGPDGGAGILAGLAVKTGGASGGSLTRGASSLALGAMMAAFTPREESSALVALNSGDWSALLSAPAGELGNDLGDELPSLGGRVPALGGAAQDSFKRAIGGMASMRPTMVSAAPVSTR